MSKEKKKKKTMQVNGRGIIPHQGANLQEDTVTHYSEN